MNIKNVYKILLAKKISEYLKEIKTTSKDPMVVETVSEIEDSLSEALFEDFLSAVPVPEDSDVLDEDDIADGSFDDYLKGPPLNDNKEGEVSKGFRFVLNPEDYMYEENVDNHSGPGIAELKSKEYLLDKHTADEKLIVDLTRLVMTRYGKEDKARRNRVREEIHSMLGKNYSRAFLLTSAMIKCLGREGKDVSYLRCAAGSCLASKLLDISHCDPVAESIPYQSFIGPDAGELEFAFNMNLACVMAVPRCLKLLLPNAVFKDESLADQYYERIRVSFLLLDEYDRNRDNIFVIFEKKEKESLDITVLTERDEDGARNAVSCRFGLWFLRDVLAESLADLVKLTGSPLQEEPENNPEVLRRFFLERDHVGLPAFESAYVKHMVKDADPTDHDDYVKIIGLSHGSGVYEGNARQLIEDGKPLSEVIGTREDVYNALLEYGIMENKAYRLMQKAGKGELTQDDVDYLTVKRVPDWMIDSLLQIRFCFPKAHCCEYLWAQLSIAYFRYKYPAAFSNAYPPFC